jgi:amino acid transporter
METFLTILMCFGIYIIFHFIVAVVMGDAGIWRAKPQSEKTEKAATGTEVEELVHQTAKM